MTLPTLIRRLAAGVDRSTVAGHLAWRQLLEAAELVESACRTLARKPE